MENQRKKYVNKRYTDKDFEGLGHYISVSDVKDDDKLKKSALEQGESYYLADENGYLIPSNIVHNFLKNKELNQYFTEQSDANDRISQQIKLRAADRQANRLTPGTGTFVGIPLALTAAGIGGATLAPLLAPGTLGGNIIGTTAFGEALNHAIKYGTGKTMGEHAVNAAHYLGIPESKWGDFGIQMIGDMPIYVTGDIIGKQVANTGHTLTKEALDQLALDNTFKGISINPTTKDLAKAMSTALDQNLPKTPKYIMTDYSRNVLGIDPEITKLSLQYPQAYFRSTGDKVKDYGYLAKGLFRKRPFDDFSRDRVLPSLRSVWDSYYNKYRSTEAYLNKGRYVDTDFTKQELMDANKYSSMLPLIKTAGIEDGDITGRSIIQYNKDLESAFTDGNQNQIKINSDRVRQAIQDYINGKQNDISEKLYYEWAREGVNPETRSGFYTNITIPEGYFETYFPNPAAKTRLNVIGKNIGITEEERQTNQQLVNTINEQLDGLGHVTGSRVTALEPYAKHKPGDTDIITTEENLPEVLKRLKVDYTPQSDVDHIKVDTPYGEADIQIIRSGSTPSTSTGQIAREIYAKSHPGEYAALHSKTSNFPEIPMDPKELLQIHNDRVFDFSQMDQMLSGKDKHIMRNIDILASSDQNVIQKAYNNMISAYKSVFGNKFRTLENQGIHIDYSNIESNKEFLKQLGMVDENIIQQLAESPDKMKFLVEDFAYQRSTANRGISYVNLDKGSKSFEDKVEDAINTNASYSNYGGNWARFLFGGSSTPGYTGNSGIITTAQFPIRNASKIKSAMDLFNEFARFSISPEGKTEALTQKNFKLTNFQISQIRNLLNIPENIKIETINDIMPWTVPNRNSYLPTANTSEGRKELSKINDELARILNIDYVYSAQEGFDNSFFGRYALDIPEMLTISQHISPQSQVGFELPTLGFSKPTQHGLKGLSLDFNLGTKARHTPMFQIQERKLETAIKQNADASQNMRELVWDTDHKIDNLRDRFKMISTLSPLVGIVGYGAKHAIDTQIAYNNLDKLIDNPDAFKKEFNVNDEQYNRLFQLQKEAYDETDEQKADIAWRKLKRELRHIQHQKKL